MVRADPVFAEGNNARSSSGQGCKASHCAAASTTDAFTVTDRNAPVFSCFTRNLWRAVDHEGEVLESFVTKTADMLAALSFLKKAMRRYGAPRVLVTDGLRSYGAAMREIGNLESREVGRHLNNRAENSHLPFRRRARAMLRFRRMSSLQRFSSTHASIQNHFNAEPHRGPKIDFQAPP